jgi:hypothetical protein
MLMKMKRLGIMLLLAGVLAKAGADETLLADYFDIKAGSGSGSEACGRINLMSNKDAHHKRIPDSYRFEITADPSGLFVIENQRDSESRLFGALKVVEGRSLPAAAQSYALSVALRDGSATLAATNITIQAVARTVQDKALAYLDRLTLGEGRFYGRRNYTDAQVAAMIEEVEKNKGGFADLGFYTKDIYSYANTKGKLGDEWAEASNRIGGLGYAYRMSKTYGPGGDAVARQQLKHALYLAITGYASRVPIAGEDVVIGGKPISPNYGDGFGMLSGKPDILQYNYISHPWRAYDALSGPAVWLTPDLTADLQAGDLQAKQVREQLVRIFQITFSNPPNYQETTSDDARWGDLTDPHHSEGAYSDANLGHRLRSWMTLLGIWADYNRPITYIPNWYPGFYAAQGGADFQFMPGWTPGGVLPDLAFWVTHFHRPSHQFVQSGFHPDGTVSHHLPGSSDIAMNAYGYGWLTEVIDGYMLLRDTPVDLGSRGYQFISDRFLYTYDKMIYNGSMDFTVCGRSYSSSMTKFVNDMPEDIAKLLESKQPGTVITNEAGLKAWRDSIVNKTQVRSGNYPFWVGQFMVHRRGGNSEKPYYYSVKMKNDRTCGAEDFDKVGKAYHSGSGILQAKVRGDEYEKSRYKWDWHALPGLTDEWRTDKIPIKYSIHCGGSPFAGMASDGHYGFAAMEYRAQPKQYASARADKAFFFTETEAVALGCNVERVNPGQGKEIITTIDQTLWVGDVTYSFDGNTPVKIKKGEAVDLTLNPEKPGWIHQGQIGYVVVPQGAQPLYIRGGAAINATDPNPSSGRKGSAVEGLTGGDVAVIHFALGHGTNPSAGLTRYYYIIAANKTADEMPDYMKEVFSRISVLSNGDGIQGVADQRLKLVQIAFYKAGEMSTPDGLTVSADRPALLQLRPVDGQWSFCATDPLHDKNAKELNLKISQPLAPGVYKYQLGGIYPRSGETVTVEPSGKGVKVNVQLPDMSDDVEYNYQAPLYAGMPVQVQIPAAAK